MADAKTEAREVTWRKLIPWTEIFRGFRITIDPGKLLLAAAGIFVMAFGWWLLAVLFSTAYKSTPPEWPSSYERQHGGNAEAAWEAFMEDRSRWNLMNRAAGLGGDNQVVEPLDVAQTPAELKQITDAVAKVAAAAPAVDLPASLVAGGLSQEDTLRLATRLALEKALTEEKLSPERAQEVASRLGRPKPHAKLATWPWSESRGPNPFLLVTGQAGIPWEAGRFWDWFWRDQAPVLVEPLVKLFSPVVYFFNKDADTYLRFYFLCVIVWTLATWSVFGGAITRIAVVQIARGERIGMRDALRYTFRRIVSYLVAPLVPLAVVFGILVLMILFGFFHMIPVFGDILVSGVFWWLMLVLGAVMAMFLLGLLGWPMMVNTISAEGTDSWEAVSRGLSYVFQRPWQYAWYALVAVLYGAVIVFVIGFLGSFTVYLGKWGVSQTFWIETAGRQPSFLFVYAPTSFGWRTLLLDDVTVGGQRLVQDGEISPEVYNTYVRGDQPESLRWWNRVGAVMVAFWIGLVFLLVLGFGYAYFWTASTIIYLLLRRSVEMQEMDEVYLEEEDELSPYGSPLTPPAPAAPAAPAAAPAGATMLEPPRLRTPEPAPSPVSGPATAPSAVPAAPPPAAPPASSTGPAAAPPAASPVQPDGNGGKEEATSFSPEQEEEKTPPAGSDNGS